jgi:uncharacterized membrane protein YbaN (DUF454 family)
MRRFLRDRRVKTVLRLVFGWFFIGLGILGLFLPILQGLIFLALGIALLAPHVPFFRRMRDAIYRHSPRTRAFVSRTRARVRLMLHRQGKAARGGN